MVPLPAGKEVVGMGDAELSLLANPVELPIVRAHGSTFVNQIARTAILGSVFLEEDEPLDHRPKYGVGEEAAQFAAREEVAPAHGVLERQAHARSLPANLALPLFEGNDTRVFLDLRRYILERLTCLADG